MLGHLICDQYVMYCKGELMKCAIIYCNVSHELKCTQMNSKHIQTVYMIRFLYCAS